MVANVLKTNYPWLVSDRSVCSCGSTVSAALSFF